MNYERQEQRVFIAVFAFVGRHILNNRHSGPVNGKQPHAPWSKSSLDLEQATTPRGICRYLSPMISSQLPFDEFD